MVNTISLGQLALGQETAAMGREQFSYMTKQTDRLIPIYERLMNSAAAEADVNSERSADQWAQYTDVFQPIENQMAAEAVAYDSPEELARREGLAAATVARQFDASEAQMGREMGRMGVSPTSSLGQQAMVDQANARALAKAGAVNKERSDTKLLGMSLRQDAARFGRNQAGTGLAASAAALQGGQAAGSLGGQSLAAAAAPGQQAGSLMSAGGAQMGSAGNTLLSQWGTRSNISANQSANDSAGLGSLIGAIGGAAIMAMSSEEAKEDITPTDDERTLGELEQVAVKDWKYKQGIADGGRHTGPIAEDVQQVMGDEVAPGGVGLDLVSMSGKHHSAIRGLANRGKKLEKRIDQLEKRVRRATGLADVVDAEFREPKLDPAVLQGDISEGIVGLASVH